MCLNQIEFFLCIFHLVLAFNKLVLFHFDFLGSDIARPIFLIHVALAVLSSQVDPLLRCIISLKLLKLLSKVALQLALLFYSLLELIGIPFPRGCELIGRTWFICFFKGICLPISWRVCLYYVSLATNYSAANAYD